MKRSSKNDEDGNSNSWMTTYSDMMTLLFAFFVLLFAISNTDAQKTELLSAALSNKLTIELFEAINEKYRVPDGSLIDMEQETQSRSEQGKPDSSLTYHGSYLDDLYRSVDTYITENDLKATISLEHSGDILLITLKDDLWFDPGSADISESMLETANVLAKLFKENYTNQSEIDIVVAGHTDNTPIKTVRYPSNWELSVARAVSFLHVLITESELPESSFSVRGYGEEHPIADNDTPEGRQKNRRVEILITESR